MLVIDASAAAEVLLNEDVAPFLLEHVLEHDLAAPELLPVEVMSVVRRRVRSGEITSNRGLGAMQDLHDWNIRYYSHHPLILSAWRLKDNVSAYDFMYVELAAELECKLLTCDKRLLNAVPHMVQELDLWSEF